MNQKTSDTYVGLCHMTVNLIEAVHHVIGRKHRQKYVVRPREHFQNETADLSLSFFQLMCVFQCVF